MQNEHKDIIGLFQSFHSGYRLSEVFGDFIEVATIALINRFTFDGDWEQREEHYHEIRKKYTEAEFGKMPEILAKLVEKFIKAGQSGTYFANQVVGGVVFQTVAFAVFVGEDG